MSILPLILPLIVTSITALTPDQNDVQTIQQANKLLQLRTQLIQQRISHLEQNYPSDILARLQARQHARRLLRSKLKRKRQLQGTGVYPGVIKHYGVHPMGFRYFVGYQRPSNKYLPPAEDNYFPNRQQPPRDYNPSVDFQPIDTPSVQPPQRPTDGPNHSVQTPILPENPNAGSDGQVILSQTPNFERPSQQPARPVIITQTPTFQRPERPIQPEQQNPTVVVQQRPTQPPIFVYPINQNPEQYQPQIPTQLQPVPNPQPIQPEIPFHYYPTQLQPQQPVHYHPVQQPVHYHPVQQPVHVHPIQQQPVHYHPVQQPVHVHPIQQQPVHIHPIQQQPVQSIPQQPHLHPIQQIPLQYYPGIKTLLTPLQGANQLHPFYQQFLRTLLQPAETPTLRVPSVTLNPVNPVLQNIPAGTSVPVGPSVPIGTSFQVSPFIRSSHPSSSVETSYSATFPRVPYPLLPFPTGPGVSGAPYLPEPPFQVVPNSHTLVSFKTAHNIEGEPSVVPNGHIPSSVHPPAISLEPPFKRSDTDESENEYNTSQSNSN